MLHIHNGDTTAETAKEAAIPGEHLAWREALVFGPAPAHLPEKQFLQVRANHLAEAYRLPVEKCAAELATMHDALAAFQDHDEVVLWFEYDLFCHVHLIYLLSWFAACELGQTKLSLICIGEFPGVKIFHGLGQLEPEQLKSLWEDRREVTETQLELGDRAWRAYSAPDAVALLGLLKSDLSALPFLRTALTKHLQRFPSIRNGLGRVENVGLELLTSGLSSFRSLFPAFMRREPEYGFGDAQLYLSLQRMANESTPFINQQDGGADGPAVTRIFHSSFEINEHGKSALKGEEDFVRANGIDLWLGGIHLKGTESAWRWDEDAQELLVSL
jgi:hypothetical protein